MLSEDTLLEKLSAPDIKVYKNVLYRICQLVDDTLSGITHYQEMIADTAFLPPNQAVQLYFDNISESEIKAILYEKLENFIPNFSTPATTPRAISPFAPATSTDSTLSSSSTSVTSSASSASASSANFASSPHYIELTPPYLEGTIPATKKISLLKSFATELAIKAVKTPLTPTEITARITNDFTDKLATNDIAVKDHYDLNRMRMILTTLFDFYHALVKLEAQRKRLSSTKEHSLYHAINNRLVAWIDHVRTGFLNGEEKILNDIFNCIILLCYRLYELDQALLSKQTLQDNEPKEIEQRTQLYNQIEKMMQPHTRQLTQRMAEIEDIRVFIDILLSLQHPRPLTDLETLRDLLKQLHQFMLKPTNIKTSSEFIIQLQTRLVVAFKRIQFSRHSAYCATFEADTLKLMTKIRNFYDQNKGHNVTPTLLAEFNELIYELKKTVDQIDRVNEIDGAIVYELCPLRMCQDSDLSRQTTHYTYSTNSRTALGTMASAITQYADKALAQQLCDDTDFTAATITYHHTFAIARLNNQIEQVIFGDPQQGLQGCKQLIEQLKRALPKNKARELQLLDELWRVINQANPFKDLDRNSLDKVLQKFLLLENDSNFAALENIQDNYSKLCRKLETLQMDLRANTYTTQVKGYRQNAQVCIADYCQWVIEHYRATGTIPKSAVQQMPALHMALIYHLIGELNMLAGNATMVNFGPEGKRIKATIKALWDDAVANGEDDAAANGEDDAVASGEDAATARRKKESKFLQSPEMQAILMGKSDAEINMSLEPIPLNLYKIIIKTMLWVDFKAIYDTQYKPRTPTPHNFPPTALENRSRVASFLQQFPFLLFTRASAALSGLQFVVQRGQAATTTTAAAMSSTQTNGVAATSSTQTNGVAAMSSTPTNKVAATSSTPTNKVAAASSTPTNKVAAASSTPTNKVAAASSTPTNKVAAASSTPTNRVAATSSTPTNGIAAVSSTPTNGVRGVAHPAAVHSPDAVVVPVVVSTIAPLASMRGCEDETNPFYILSRSRVIDPKVLLAALLQIRDKLYELMPKTMEKSCPKTEQPSERHNKKMR